MKQILFAGAGMEFPKGAFSFLTRIHDQERLHVKALFFEPIDYFALASSHTGESHIPVMELEENKKELVKTQKDEFVRQCEQRHIQYSLEDNTGEWDKELIVRASRFADLLIVSARIFYGGTKGDLPSLYLRETLHAAECPVLIVPEDYSGVQHLYMAYDGGRDSLYAIKQFCYLFPWLADLPTEMLYVRDEPGDDIPELENLKQFSRMKFDAMGFSKLHFKAEDYFATWVSEKKYSLLVTGSFGRSHLSYIAKQSFAEQVIHDHKLPVFIAHH